MKKNGILGALITTVFSLTGCGPSIDTKALTAQCDQGNLSSCIKAGEKYSMTAANAKGEKRNELVGKTMYHYSRACKLGSGWACEQTANIFMNQGNKARYYFYLGKTVETTPENAKRFALKVAHGYHFGHGIPKDRALAVKYAKRGCEVGKDQKSCSFYRKITHDDKVREQYRADGIKRTEAEKRREAERIEAFKKGGVGFGTVAYVQASCREDWKMGLVSNYQECVRNGIERKRRENMEKYKNY